MMKVDRNQMVGGFMEPHETHKDRDVDYHAGLHVGGIPLCGWRSRRGSSPARWVAA